MGYFELLKDADAAVPVSAVDIDAQSSRSRRASPTTSSGRAGDSDGQRQNCSLRPQQPQPSNQCRTSGDSGSSDRPTDRSSDPEPGQGAAGTRSGRSSLRSSAAAGSHRAVAAAGRRIVSAESVEVGNWRRVAESRSIRR